MIPESIRILGIDWKIGTVERFDEPDKVMETDHQGCIIVLAEHLHPARRGFNIFWGIMRAIDEDLLHEEAVPKKGERDAAYMALWIALRDNWPLVKQWFGSPPEVVHGSRLRIHGMTFTLQRVNLIPDQPGEVVGLCAGNVNTIYLREGMSPQLTSLSALHELTHGSVQTLSRLGDVKAFVAPMASALAQVFFDNPEAMRSLLEEDGDVQLSAPPETH